jgi:hypothetical protein
MSDERIREDLPRIEAGARELLAGALDYETALREYFPALAAAVRDPGAIFTFDRVHERYLGAQ